MTRSVSLAAGTRRASNHVAAAEEARLRAIAEDAARQKELYGPHADDARVLRVRGFVVTAEGGDRFRVGNQILDGAALQAKADRERRLMGAPAEVRKPTETATGLAIGQAEPLAPKKAKPAPRAADAPARRLSGAAAASQAKAAEHSTDLGVRPRVVWLDLGLLTVDRRYQREISGGGTAHINRILRAFNWNRYQPIVVTESADGTFAVIDGQHRLEAAKKHPLIRELPCYVIDAPDLEAQAAIFVSVNRDRRGLTSLQKFWASVAAGDREATALATACEVAGVTVPRAPPSGGLSPMTLLGPNVVLRLVGRFGRAAALQAIALIGEAWPAAVEGFRVGNLAALTAIAATPYSRERLLRALKRLDPDKLHAESLALAGSASSRALALAVEKLVRQEMLR